MAKKVLWVANLEPVQILKELLSKELKDDVSVKFIEGIERAEDIVKILQKDFDEVVIDFDDVCEISKLLDYEIYPLVPIVTELHICLGPGHCKDFRKGLDYFEKSGNKLRHMRVGGFKRIVDIAFEILDPHEHIHEHHH